MAINLSLNGYEHLFGFGLSRLGFNSEGSVNAGNHLQLKLDGAAPVDAVEQMRERCAGSCC